MSPTAPRPTGPDDAATPPPGLDHRADPATTVRGDDDRDVGWGDDLDGDRGGRDARWYEEQRPPHWE